MVNSSPPTAPLRGRPFHVSQPPLWRVDVRKDGNVIRQLNEPAWEGAAVEVSLRRPSYGYWGNARL